MFAFSCLSHNQIWKEQQLPGQRKREILNQGKELLDKLLPEGLRERRKDSDHPTDDEYTKQTLFKHDRLTLPLLAQHLESELSRINCKIESSGSNSGPDLIVQEKISKKQILR